MELLVSVIVGAAIIEAYAWLPTLCCWLADKTASFAPIGEQERCREEWTGSLEAIPNSAFRLVHALTFIFAVWRIRHDFRAQAAEEIDEAIIELATMGTDAEHLWGTLAARVNDVVVRGADHGRHLTEASERLVNRLSGIRRSVELNASQRIPAEIAPDLVSTLLHCANATSGFREQALNVVVKKPNKLAEEFDRMVVNYREQIAKFQRHIPRLESLRTSNHLRYKEWEAAYYNICTDIGNDAVAFDKVHDEIAFCWNGTESDDEELNATEFHAAFAALKSLTASLRQSRLSQAHRVGT